MSVKQTLRLWVRCKHAPEGSTEAMCCTDCLSDGKRTARADALREAAEVAKLEIMVRARAHRLGAHLHDPDGSVFGEQVAERIRQRGEAEERGEGAIDWSGLDDYY